VAGPAKKVTELTIGYTNIGSINITIYLPGNLAMRNLLFTQFVGSVHQIGSRSIVIQVNPFFLGQKIKPQSALQQIGCIHVNKDNSVQQ
jgi:hypothetical protein